MGRIRTLKPEFFRSRKLARCSLGARLTFQGLWLEADDFGRGIAEPRVLAGAIWPLDDDIGWQDVAGHLDELEREGRIARYEVDGETYYEIPSWEEHQAAAYRRGKAVHPERLHDQECKNVQAAPMEVKDRAVTGNVEVELVLDDAPARDPVEAIFEAWCEFTGHHKAVLDKKRRTTIVNARRHYPDDDLIAACRGVTLASHNQGQNERGMRYDDIGLVLRDAEHIERFRDLAQQTPLEPPTIDFDPDPPKPNGRRCDLCKDEGGWLTNAAGEATKLCEHRVPA